MARRRRRVVVSALCGVILVGPSTGCGGTPAGDASSPRADMVDGGSWYVRQPWPHDGNPVTSENFVVYSDAASVEAREMVAGVAEEALAVTITKLGLDPESMFRFPPGQDRIDIYAYHGYDPRGWGGRAYHAGFLIWSPDHERRQNERGDYGPVLHHELVHVVQWLLTGPEASHVDTWFIDGLPEALAGGTTGGAIRGMDQLDDLTDRFGRINPISVKTYAQITGADVGERYHYPMFQLAVEYLVDDAGLGRSYRDVANVLIDVAGGATFEAAFADHMGMPLGDLEDGFFTLMGEYLPPYRSPIFSPLGFTAVSVAVSVLVLGALAVGHRRWSAPTGSQAGRRRRVGVVAFRAEMTLGVIVVLSSVLGVLFFVGTAYELNNARFAHIRRVSYWTVLGYLVVSVGVLRWAVHRRAHDARAAHLVVPLVIAATAAMVAALDLVL